MIRKRKHEIIIIDGETHGDVQMVVDEYTKKGYILTVPIIEDRDGDDIFNYFAHVEYNDLSENKNVDVDNFNNFTKDEYIENLSRLCINKHSDLIGKEVYYSKPSYGVHIVLNWDRKNGEYLLSCGGCRFYSNPFRIKLIKNK